MPSTSTDSPDAGAARTLILRLRHEPETGGWRGQAICVQTGAAVGIRLESDEGDVAQFIEVLQQLLGMPAGAPNIPID